MTVEDTSALAEDLGLRGKEAFLKGEFDVAKLHYSRALGLDTLSRALTMRYTLNRAKCYLKLKSWSDVQKDAQRVIALGDENVTAYYLLGKSLLYQNKFEDGLSALRKARTLAESRNLTGTAKEALWAELEGKNMQWQMLESERKAQLTVMMDHVIQAQTIPSQSKASIVNLIKEKSERAQIPDWMICSITMELMKDPVVSPVSGITYERQALADTIRKYGAVDPQTRQSFDSSRVVPNVALKNAIEEFIEKNPWAVEEWFCSSQA